MSSALYAQTAVQTPDLGSLISEQGFSSSVSVMVLMSSITLFPFFVISTTSFLRTVVVFALLRQALGTQQAPPNMAIIGLAMFLTIFIMTPTLQMVHTNAILPYQNNEISQSEAINEGIEPFKQFMLKHASNSDLALFLEFSKMQYTTNKQEISIFVIIPAFMLSELKAAFQIGFLLFIPFLVIDLIISNILLSLGMFMLSPAMISMPFKILLFVLTDGWNLVTRGLLLSFQ
jgi:flagellar biosynthetic protein FliP